MLLKRIDSLGNKTYVNAFDGRTYTPLSTDPFKKPSNDYINSQMNSSSAPAFGCNLKEEIANNQRSVFIGEYKMLIGIKSKNRDKKDTVIICKRVNVNPWPLLSQNKRLTKRERQLLTQNN